MRITIKTTDGNGRSRRATLVKSNGEFVATGDASKYQIKQELKGLIRPGTVIKKESEK